MESWNGACRTHRTRNRDWAGEPEWSLGRVAYDKMEACKMLRNYLLPIGAHCPRSFPKGAAYATIPSYRASGKTGWRRLRGTQQVLFTECAVMRCWGFNVAPE